MILFPSAAQFSFHNAGVTMLSGDHCILLGCGISKSVIILVNWLCLGYFNYVLSTEKKSGERDITIMFCRYRALSIFPPHKYDLIIIITHRHFPSYPVSSLHHTGVLLQLRSPNLVSNATMIVSVAPSYTVLMMPCVAVSLMISFVTVKYHT